MSDDIERAPSSDGGGDTQMEDLDERHPNSVRYGRPEEQKPPEYCPRQLQRRYPE